ncbi:single-stranded DNA-binding protein [Patescibacteria group bacterium]|nr:single-stranded DNA-binding protein [Patescibacteria group bacterium]
MNLNKVFVLGNLTADPIVRALPSGQSVANFGLATNRIFYDRDRQKQQRTEFHNIVAFGRSAEIAQQYLRKGSMVLIEGRIQTRNWQDSSGNKRYRTEIITERLQLGPRTASFQTTSPEPSVPNQTQKEMSQEEIPIIEEWKEEEKPSSTQEPQATTAENPPKDKDQNNEEIDVSQIPF